MTDKTEEQQEEISPENKLKIKRVTRNEKGGVDYVFSLNYAQTYILLDFAIRFLITQGLAEYIDVLQDQVPSPATAAEEEIVLDKRLH